MKPLIYPLAVMLTLPGVAWGQPDGTPPTPPPPPPGFTPGPACPAFNNRPVFDSLDTNRDGKVDAAEWGVLDPSGTLFRDMDTRHQGYLTLDEMNASHPPGWIDQNHDCKISIDEMRAALHVLYQSAPPKQATHQQ